MDPCLRIEHTFRWGFGSGLVDPDLLDDLRDAWEGVDEPEPVGFFGNGWIGPDFIEPGRRIARVAIAGMIAAAILLGATAVLAGLVSRMPLRNWYPPAGTYRSDEQGRLLPDISDVVP